MKKDKIKNITTLGSFIMKVTPVTFEPHKRCIDCLFIAEPDWCMWYKKRIKNLEMEPDCMVFKVEVYEVPSMEMFV